MTEWDNAGRVARRWIGSLRGSVRVRSNADHPIVHRADIQQEGLKSAESLILNQNGTPGLIAEHGNIDKVFSHLSKIFCFHTCHSDFVEPDAHVLQGKPAVNPMENFRLV